MFPQESLYSPPIGSESARVERMLAAVHSAYIEAPPAQVSGQRCLNRRNDASVSPVITALLRKQRADGKQFVRTKSCVETTRANVPQQHACNCLRSDIQVLPHPRKRLRRVSGRAVARSTDVIEDMLAESNSPRIDPEPSLEDGPTELNPDALAINWEREMGRWPRSVRRGWPFLFMCPSW